MSGNSKNKSRSRGGGWEEAGGEFYQELYPGTEADVFDNLQRADAATLPTLLPSKHIRNNTTVKRVRSQNERRQSTLARTMHSRDVHLSMLPDLSENLSNEERTWEEIMLIKAMPVPMAEKRELKASLQNATKLRLQGLEHLHWKQRKVWYRFRIRFNEIIGKLELWHGTMREIEGKFGTGVVSYFLFLRWLLFLNLVISLLVILFLILPKILLVERPRYCPQYDLNSTECCSEAYLERNLTDSNIILDIIQGTGVMERTILFYGVYSDQLYTYYLGGVFKNALSYYMPIAYIATPIVWALLTLVLIVKSGARGVRERLVENEGQFYKYCNLVFGGWDYCIRNDKSANIKHLGLYNEVKWSLKEQKYKEEKQSRSREGQIILFFKRLLINLLVFIILVASGVFIYFVFNFSMASINHIATNLSYRNGTLVQRFKLFTDLSELQKTFFEFLPFLCIVILNVIVPVLLSYLSNFERYTPTQMIVISLLRTVLLRLSSLGVLIWQMSLNVKKNNLTCSLSYENSNSIECWETYVGQQLYKLILTDFAVQFITTFVINLPRAMLARHTDNKCLKIIGEQDFYLPKHVLDVVYTQTIIWMGTFYCPFLPIIGTILYLIMFYVKKFTCLINCTPSPVVYRASKSKSLFMSVLLLGFIISIVPVAYSIAELKPSFNCGPFRGWNTVWTFVIYIFDKLPFVLREIIFLMGTSSFAVPLFAVLLVALYYYWAVGVANRHMVGVLKKQLVLEGHDKQFLLNRLSAFIRQHQKRCRTAGSNSCLDHTTQSQMDTAER